MSVDAAAGIIRIEGYRSAGPLDGLGSGSVALIDFQVKANAPAGAAAINLLQNAGTTWTSVGGMDGQGNNYLFDLEPRPSNAAGNVLDGRIDVVQKDEGGVNKDEGGRMKDETATADSSASFVQQASSLPAVETGTDGTERTDSSFILHPSSLPTTSSLPMPAGDTLKDETATADPSSSFILHSSSFVETLAAPVVRSGVTEAMPPVATADAQTAGPVNQAADLLRGLLIQNQHGVSTSDAFWLQDDIMQVVDGETKAVADFLGQFQA